MQQRIFKNTLKHFMDGKYKPKNLKVTSKFIRRYSVYVAIAPTVATNIPNAYIQSKCSKEPYLFETYIETGYVYSS